MWTFISFFYEKPKFGLSLWEEQQGIGFEDKKSATSTSVFEHFFFWQNSVLHPGIVYNAFKKTLH